MVGKFMIPLPKLKGAWSDGGKQRVHNHWRSLCYSLHAILVVLHLILLGVAVSHHPEHQVVIKYVIEMFTTGLSGGLQAFYTVSHPVNETCLNKLIDALLALHCSIGLRHSEINAVRYFFQPKEADADSRYMWRLGWLGCRAERSLAAN